MELQKPVDRRFKSDHPHARALAAVAVLLLAFPTVPLAGAAVQGNETSGTVLPMEQTTGANTCLTDPGQAPAVSPSTRVALVKPLFTATPYSQYNYGSFYAFYAKHRAAVGNITSDLGLLNTSVSSAMHYNMGWGHSYPLYSFMESQAAQNCGLVLGKNLMLVSDINVSEGVLFGQNGSARFDVVVVGFAEYVSGPEYAQLVRFVSQGGRLVIMGGDTFQVRVRYDPRTNYETYVLGHGFEYNNRTAWRTVPLKLGFNLPRFIGATACCFRNGTFSGAKLNLTNSIGHELGSAYGGVVFKAYVPHEEDSVKNFSHISMIAVFSNTSRNLVASFARQYGKGTIVCFCAFADDAMQDPSVQYFSVLAVGTPAKQLFVGVSGSHQGQGTDQGAGALVLSVALAAGAVATAAWVYHEVGRRRERH